jgi:hypothetical protein
MLSLSHKVRSQNDMQKCKKGLAYVLNAHFDLGSGAHPMWLQISTVFMKVIWKIIVIMHNMVVDDEERDVEFNSIF